MNNYPCRDCIVRCNCSSICSEITDSALFNHSIMNEHRCPDCGEGLVGVADVSNGFYVITCMYCESRFAMEFWTSTTNIIRSVNPKGMIDGFIYKTKTIATFIEECWRAPKYEYE